MISTKQIGMAMRASGRAVRASGRAMRASGGLVARRLFLDRQVELWAAALDAAWSPTEIRARVIEVIRETSDTRTFVLEPNARWRGHRAGQYVSLEVEIDGVRVRRCYSIASAPGEPHLALTVKRAPEGRVSNWLHDRLRAGDVVRMGPAAGDFVLPSGEAANGARGLLFVSGGSGITPVMSMLRELAARGPIDDLVFVHHARSRADVIFGAELQRLAAAHRGLRLVVRTDDEPDGRFDERRLAEIVPDFAARATFLCGPPPLMERVERMYEAAGATAQLKRERFGLLPSPSAASAASPSFAPPLPPGIDALGVEIHLARSGRRFTANCATPLLDQLERAGERPPYGCRIGICHTCQCTKRSGTVQNSLTGAISSEPNQKIQLCISVPRSDVELEEETS